MAALLKNPRDSFLIAKGYTLSPHDADEGNGKEYEFFLIFSFPNLHSQSKRDHWFVEKKRSLVSRR